MSLDELRAKLGELSRKIVREHDEAKLAALYEEYGEAYRDYSMRCGELGLPADR